MRWPNVTLSQLPRFEASLDRWFGRQNIPLWITEYGYQTKPADPLGVTEAQQAQYLAQVMRQLKADPRVQMFVWFIFRDSANSHWQSGVSGVSGTPEALLQRLCLPGAIRSRTDAARQRRRSADDQARRCRGSRS